MDKHRFECTLEVNYATRTWLCPAQTSELPRGRKAKPSEIPSVLFGPMRETRPTRDVHVERPLLQLEAIDIHWP